jgi:hypothetical protein
MTREYTAGTLHDHTPEKIRALLTELENVDPPGLVHAVQWALGIPAPAPFSREGGSWQPWRGRRKPCQKRPGETRGGT